MYSKLKLNGRTKEHIDVVDAKLNNLGHIEFIDISDEYRELLENENDIIRFLKMLFYFNGSYRSKRYSARYKRFVNSGNTAVVAGTNRSVIDLYSLAKKYNPQFANLRKLYEALIFLYSNVLNFNTLKCSQIRRRVWYWRRNASSLATLLDNNANCLNQKLLNYLSSYLRGEDELGTTFTVEKNNGDPKIIINYVE